MASGKKDYNIDFVLCQPPLCEKPLFYAEFSRQSPAPLCEGSRRAFGATEELYPQPITAFTQGNLICEHSVNSSKYLLHFYNFGVYIGEGFLKRQTFRKQSDSRCAQKDFLIISLRHL